MKTLLCQERLRHGSASSCILLHAGKLSCYLYHETKPHQTAKAPRVVSSRCVKFAGRVSLTQLGGSCADSCTRELLSANSNLFFISHIDMESLLNCEGLLTMHTRNTEGVVNSQNTHQGLSKGKI